jgi:SAM-dependent methyltransferase
MFSRHALAYQRRLEDIMSRGESPGRMRALTLLDARPGMRILDLACGPGTLSRRLAAMVVPGGVVVGVDLAPGMIELARAMHVPSARFEIMDIENLEFEDGAFDAAICGHGLQYASDLSRALGESRRVIRPSGRLAASVPVTAHREAVWMLLDSVIDRWLPPAPLASDQESTRATVQDSAAFQRAAIAAGFAKAAVELVEETVRWQSADHIVTSFVAWVDSAARIEGMDTVRRQAMMNEAIEAVRRDNPGPIVTKGRNHVLFAEA